VGFRSITAMASRSVAAGLNASLLLNRRKGLSLCSRSSREGFSFLLPEQKKRNKENSPSALFVLLRHFSPLNKKNSLTLKQLFVFHAPKSTSASRPKSEAGPLCFFATSLRSLGVWCFLFLLRFIFSHLLH
jgi:hypothetical protein